MKPYVLSTNSLSVPKRGFYVYELINPSTNDPFYVGKGTRTRCFDHMKETHLQQHSHKTHTISQILSEGLQVVVEIVLISLNESECLQHEQALITRYGKRAQGGLLTNVLDGGEHSTPVPKTLEQREQQRQAWLGDKNPTKGRLRTPEEVATIAATRKERIAAGLIAPVNHTDEHKQKMREYNPGGEATARAIYQIDPNTGQVLATWKSLRAAGIELKIHSWRNISTVLVNSRNQIVAGFYWRWVDDAVDVVEGVLQNITELNKNRSVKSNAKNFIIIQQSECGTEIEWENMVVAMLHTGIHNSGISAAIKSGKKYGGYYWERRPKMKKGINSDP